ncbi:MAG: hypothetical protein OK455_10885 [Thaumarchaeota archaeon]|nr:hypothetical protein [Nitrososphaerota archaeon]
MIISVHVVSLTGLIEYVTAYRVVVNVFVGNGHLLNASFISNDTASFLYPGSTWGPLNVTLPVTAQNTNLATGQSTNATVSITLQDEVYYGVPRYNTETEPAMQGEAGGLLIQNVVASTTTSTQVSGGTGQNYLPYALLSSGAVLMVLGVFLTRGPRPPKATEK